MATVATIAETTIVGDNEDQLVTMVVDNQLFGIPILQVQDIVEASKITPVPLAPSAIAGVLNLRGRIVTVVDLRKLLGNHEEVPWESQMGVTVDYKGDLYTLLVDAIGDVRTLPKNDFDKAPSTMEDNVRRLCSGIYRLRGNLLVVLDVGRILKTEIIEATPMLTVEERRSRKSAAVAKSEGGDARAHQLSALMTDLNAYESETEGVFGAATDTGEDDIKARKRASRQRRPIAERWQEVLEEKARKAGHVTYRMREPDEETVEIARDEMAKEDAEWAARVMDHRDAPPAEEAPPVDIDVPVEAASDLPPPAPADPADPAHRSAPMEADRGPDAGAEPREPATDLPELFDAAPDLPIEESAAEAGTPATPDAPPEMPAGAPVPESEARPEVDPAADADVREPGSDDPEPSDKTESAGPEQAPISEREFGGITSGWWNKLRGKAGGNTESDTPEASADDPQPDPTEPAADGPEPVAKATGKAKPEKKPTTTRTKTTAKKKTTSKSKKSAKSGGKSAAKAKPKKKS